VAADPTAFSAPIHETNGTTLVPKEPLFAETPKRPATNGTNGPPVYYPPETNDMFTKTPPDAPLLMVAYLKSDLNFVSWLNSNLSVLATIAFDVYGRWRQRQNEVFCQIFCWRL
jgi:hypothetical protein